MAARVRACNSNKKPTVRAKLLKIEHPVMCLATMGYVYVQLRIHVTTFSTGGKFRPVSNLLSYMLLLKPPVLMRSCTCSCL